jgi:hypothetical protein
MTWISAIAGVLVLAVVAAGCGGSGSPGGQGSGSPPSGRAPATGSTASVMARFVAYARCMRSHGIRDYPDPTTSPGGGVSFQVNGGPGSDLNKNNPTFKAANRVCQALLPGGGAQPPALSAQRIAAEVKWAQCMRSHGLPSFPDPNDQGAFDSSKFDENSPAFQTANDACKSQQPAGPTPVVPGRG